MINLDKKTRAHLYKIFLGEEYEALKLLQEEMTKSIKAPALGVKPTQWSLTQETLMRDGRVDGIKKFLEAIKQVSDKYNEEIKKGK